MQETRRAPGDLAELRERLRERADLYDDPAAFAAGVDAALAAVTALADQPPRQHPDPRLAS